MRKTIICLANSYKHGGRCVAGADADSGCWIRLRGAAPDGSLTAAEYTLEGGGEPKLLDAIEVDLDRAVPSRAHPEDWKIAPMRWKLVDRPANAANLQKLAVTMETAAAVLGGYRDRVGVAEVQQKPASASLALIEPAELHWWIREEGDKRRNRAIFRRNHVTYDFAVTDPRWLDQLNLLPVGMYPHAMLAGEVATTWLTVSLSEPYFGWHYKLVAAVISRAR